MERQLKIIACCTKAVENDCCTRAVENNCCTKVVENNCCTKTVENDCCGKAVESDYCTRAVENDCCTRAVENDCCGKAGAKRIVEWMQEKTEMLLRGRSKENCRVDAGEKKIVCDDGKTKVISAAEGASIGTKNCSENPLTCYESILCTRWTDRSCHDTRN